MRQSFMNIMCLAAIVEGTGAAPLTSEKLVALQTEYDEKRKLIRTTEEGPEFENLVSEVYKLRLAIKAEETAIVSHQKELAAIEARNAKMAIVDEMIAAVLASNVVNADKKATQEAKDAAYATAKDLTDKVKNLVAGSAPVKSAVVKDGTGKTSEPKGATGAKIRERLLFHIGEGKTATEAVKAVMAEGFARGTTGSVRTAMKEAGEITD